MTRIIGATGALLRAFGALPLLLMAATAPAQTVSNDGCGDGGNGPADIEKLAARYDAATDQFEVTLTTCGPVDRAIKYRVRFDHFVNQEEYPKGSGTLVDATLSSGNPYCLAVSDDQMMLHKSRKTAGPGAITVSDRNILYTVKRSELSSSISPGHVVRIWAETQDKKRVDRAPNTDATDSCAEPQYLTEVLQQTVLDRFAIVGTQAFDILRAPTRLFESAMGNLVADALLAGTPGAEVALTNSGGLRADLRCVPPASGEQPCEITWDELFKVLPFGNNTVIETVTGAQLEEALLNGLTPSCNPMIATGRFPQVAGLEVSYTCVGMVPQINSISLRPDGMGGPAIPLAPGDSVRLVTNDFMYFGGDGYLVLTLGTDVVFTEISLLELAGAYISANSPVQPFVEGRIVKMAP